jgi:CubicO group peptidase (beta-lactamase class C family)
MGHAAFAAPTSPLPVASPAQVGISAARLARLRALMQTTIDSEAYLGAVTLIARDGKVVDWRAFGSGDLARAAPLQPDAIFRIYSMTKTVASVAALMLVEEGKLALDDPVSRLLPEFARMEVFVGGSAEAPRTRPASRSITVRHLLTHAAGFAVGGDDAPEAVRKLNEAALQTSSDLATYCKRLSTLPLAAEPGSRFNYDGVQINVLSRVVEVAARQSFDAFLAERIFAPLRMIDTGFEVSADKRSRIAQMTSTDSEGRLIAAPEYANKRSGERLNPYPSGAGGLYSTAADYVRFAQMLLNGGELDGARLLSPRSVQLMMTNQLDTLEPPRTEFRPGEGFGLGGYVVVDVARRGRPGSLGQFGWFGAASTYYVIDPKERLIALLLMQHLGPSPALRATSPAGEVQRPSPALRATSPAGEVQRPARLDVEFYNHVYQTLSE